MLGLRRALGLRAAVAPRRSLSTVSVYVNGEKTVSDSALDDMPGANARRAGITGGGRARNMLGGLLGGFSRGAGVRAVWGCTIGRAHGAGLGRGAPPANEL